MAAVILSPYSSEWPDAFLTAREELLYALSPSQAKVEHVGSTSVPGLAAKPVLDILLGVTSLLEVESKISALADTGYAYIKKYEAELPDRRYFVKPAPPLRIHLHAVEVGSAFWLEHLAFRDMLRSDAALRSAYQDLKLELAAQHPRDKGAYQAAKAPFIRSALAAASNEG